MLVSYHLGDHSQQLIQSSHHRQLLELWSRRHSVITLLRLLARSRPDPRLTLGEKISRSRWVSLRWCRPAHSVARQCGCQRSSPAVPRALQYFCYQGCIARCNLAPSVSTFWGERSNGFMLTRLMWILGTNVP